MLMNQFSNIIMIHCRAFQSFDVNQTAPANANYTANTNLGGGSFYDAGVYGTDPTATDGTNYDDEPPLLEGNIDAITDMILLLPTNA